MAGGRTGIRDAVALVRNFSSAYLRKSAMLQTKIIVYKSFCLKVKTKNIPSVSCLVSDFSLLSVRHLVQKVTFYNAVNFFSAFSRKNSADIRPTQIFSAKAAKFGGWYV